MRVIVTGGGTGGHIYPALAIADKFKEMDETTEILYVGNEEGIEKDVVPKTGYPLTLVDARWLDKSNPWQLIKTGARVAKGILEAGRVMRKFRPDVVIGTGGYVFFPLIRAAAALGVPTVLHESNARPGMAVRMLEEKTDLLFLNFEESRKFLKHPEKAVRVGNPLRIEENALTKEQARRALGIAPQEKYLLSLGGSMGAEQVNFCMLDVMEQYS